MRPGLALYFIHNTAQTCSSAINCLRNMEPILTNTDLVVSSGMSLQDAVAGKNYNNVSIDVVYCQCVAAYGLDAIESL